MQKNTHLYKKILITLALLLPCAGAGYYYWSAYHHPSIYTFDQERDTQQILAIFQQEWHWLVTSKDYSPEFTLKYLAPTRNPAYLGKLNINVLRQGNDLIGFVAYYLKSPELGQLLFLAINKDYRRKGYGERLLRHGLSKLEQMGAQKIRILTRTTNPAYFLYRKVGFRDYSRDEADGIVYLEYDPKTASQPEAATA
jgi:ribosomal protein S18 acetylase RimI-like enzyme